MFLCVSRTSVAAALALAKKFRPLRQQSELLSLVFSFEISLALGLDPFLHAVLPERWMLARWLTCGIAASPASLAAFCSGVNGCRWRRRFFTPVVLLSLLACAGRLWHRLSLLAFARRLWRRPCAWPRAPLAFACGVGEADKMPVGPPVGPLSPLCFPRVGPPLGGAVGRPRARGRVFSTL